MTKQTTWRTAAVAFLCGSLFFSGLAAAQDGSSALSFLQLKMFVKGEDRTPAGGTFDNQGTEVPAALIYKNTTYIPVRMASELLGEPVYWDGADKSVWIGTVDVPLVDAQGAVIGHAKLAQAEGGVSVDVEASKLTPGRHGFHLHEKTFEGGGVKTAGGHYNPEGKEHGHDNPEGKHAGDFPNLTAGEDGTVKQTVFLEGLTLEKGKDGSVWGKSFIIHAAADDYKTDPSGNSGDRIAGGNIQ